MHTNYPSPWLLTTINTQELEIPAIIRAKNDSFFYVENIQWLMVIGVRSPLSKRTKNENKYGKSIKNT